MNLVNIENLYFSYNNNMPYIIENINLKIKKGDYISILGENGSGKTTLSKLILNLLKPTKGKVSLNTNKIGYVPQNIENFNSKFPITVNEILKCHKKIINLKSKDIISKILKLVNMEHTKNSLIGNLSGGQQQKIFICRALIGNPELLILDEPSTGVDIKSQIEIYNIIKKLNKKNNITIIAVEHNLDAALKNSSHIYLMKNGTGHLYNIEHFKNNYLNTNFKIVNSNN
ncbi:high-affinity zinc uptake system ATP-binding protein ZnuC [Clostridium acetireducens DSM 10703]|jgi:zinc transport system ATP-binding protein|uniref:High-affinity zinc uptake system ATP-binding protein ZnuC n=1 Tax=Clostridium acetireducens DSM 10703 TaxID=1121290 RepID=A0A1E8F1K4_9CLOT|nr:metal ABC transporter ATP-binding protein [Clostridium acetireducens]OFI07029.1 high-affinity zinc uptake system ATP-binding protein ZnuC [Clostridium acetireducens DSM 10703]